MKRIKKGMKFKSYKDLCEHLEQEPKEGSAKAPHLESFKELFEYEREGNSYTITKLKRNANSAVIKYSRAQKNKILDLALLNSIIALRDVYGEEYEIDLKRIDMLKELNLLKNNYNKYDTDTLSKEMNTDNLPMIYDIVSLEEASILSKIENSFTRLQVSNCILFETRQAIIIKGTDVGGNFYKTELKDKKMIDFVLQSYLDNKFDLLEKNPKKISNIMAGTREEINEFYQELTKRVNKDVINKYPNIDWTIESICQKYRIRSTKLDNLLEKQSYKSKELERIIGKEEAMKIFIKEHCDSRIDSSKNRQSDMIGKKKHNKSFRADDNYIYANRKLLEIMYYI